MRGLIKALLLVGAGAGLFSMAANATLDCTITVDGTQVGVCATSNTGALSFDSITASALFASITLTANGAPDLPQPDLSSVTLDVSTSGTFTGSHVLGVDVFQTGVAAPIGTTLESTATINNLIGVPGPTTLSDFFNGTSGTLGTTLQSQTFASGVIGTGGPLFNTLATALDADAQQFLITFTGASQSANDTLQLQGVIPGVPEPSTLSIVGGALLAGWFARWRRGTSG